MTKQLKKFQHLLRTKACLPVGRAFTLVELIIVIAIVAILSVVAFLIVTKWIGKSKDARRLSDLTTIKKSLAIYGTEHTNYPDPDGITNVISSGGAVLWTQGQYGTGILKQSGGSINRIPTDPTGDTWYAYSVTRDKKKYQAMTILEDGTQQTYQDSVYASTPVARIDGYYDGFIVTLTGSNQYIIWKVPSLFVDLMSYSGTAQLTGGSLVISGSMKIFTDNQNAVIATGQNVPNVDVSAIKTSGIATTDQINTIKAVLGITDIQATQLVNSVVGGSVSVTAPANCTGTVYSGYTITALNSGITQTFSKSITYGTGNIDATCNNGSLSYVDKTPTCNSGYIVQGLSCVLDQCGGSISDVNGISNASSVGVSGTWNHSSTPGLCTWDCKSGYNWNGSSCSLVNYFTGDGTILNPYRYYTESSSAINVVATGCQTYNLNATTKNDGSPRLSGTCGNGSQACLFSGIYLIDPDGNGGVNAFKTSCDMSTNGGGWTIPDLSNQNFISYSTGSSGSYDTGTYTFHCSTAGYTNFRAYSRPMSEVELDVYMGSSSARSVLYLLGQSQLFNYNNGLSVDWTKGDSFSNGSNIHKFMYGNDTILYSSSELSISTKIGIHKYSDGKVLIYSNGSLLYTNTTNLLLEPFTVIFYPTCEPGNESKVVISSFKYR